MHAVVDLLDGLAEGDLFFYNGSEEREQCSFFLVHVNALTCTGRFTVHTSMCTTRSDIVLASLFSSIILSRPRALGPRLSRLPFPPEDEPEWAELSMLGVGVVERERLFDRGARESLPPPPSDRPLSEDWEWALLDGNGFTSFAEDRALEAAALVSAFGVVAILADSFE